MFRKVLVVTTPVLLLLAPALQAQCAVCMLSVQEVPDCAWGPYRDASEDCDSDGNTYCYVWGSCGGSVAKLAAPSLLRHWTLLGTNSLLDGAREEPAARTLMEQVAPEVCGHKPETNLSAARVGA
jgi:hypothetical protein